MESVCSGILCLIVSDDRRAFLYLDLLSRERCTPCSCFNGVGGGGGGRVICIY